GRGFGVRLTVSFSKQAHCALVAPIPKGRQARLYHRRANTSPIDSSQLRTFSDNVPHSKKTRLRTQRRRTTEWVFHQEEPQTSVIIVAPSVDFPVATPNPSSESVWIG